MKKKMIFEIDLEENDLPLFYMVKAKIIEYLWRHFDQNKINYKEEG